MRLKVKKINQCDKCKKFKRWDELEKVEEMNNGAFDKEYYICKDSVRCWKIKLDEKK